MWRWISDWSTDSLIVVLRVMNKAITNQLNIPQITHTRYHMLNIVNVSTFASNLDWPRPNSSFAGAIFCKQRTTTTSIRIMRFSWSNKGQFSVFGMNFWISYPAQQLSRIVHPLFVTTVHRWLVSLSLWWTFSAFLQLVHRRDKTNLDKNKRRNKTVNEKSRIKHRCPNYDRTGRSKTAFLRTWNFSVSQRELFPDVHLEYDTIEASK